MKVGFTGTKRGMTGAQKAVVTDLIKRYCALELVTFYHGGDKGADYDFHQLVMQHTDGVISIFPGHDAEGKSPRRMPEVQDPRVVWNPSQPYLTRNQTIAGLLEVLIATPQEFEEVMRSGTWATVRYTRTRSKLVTIVYPDGKIEVQRGS